MTQWAPCSERVGGILPMWRACRMVDGMRETDISIYGTQGEALKRARELNAKEKAPAPAGTDTSARE
ncbi:hypothetical protein [Selenomonas artemidis]|uniref:hypothetical protein n=1 Tax=Selenomonas artemidis TaxID=671224 RepID=UPI00040A7FC5|nr:hypothetical protein [Selenomonas artemidis]